MAKYEMINHEEWTDIHNAVHHILKICHGMIVRWQDQPFPEEKPASYRKAIRECCQSFGLGKIIVSKDFHKIYTSAMVQGKVCKIRLKIMDAKQATYSIEIPDDQEG